MWNINIDYHVVYEQHRSIHLGVVLVNQQLVMWVETQPSDLPGNR